jgi:dihydroorotate dehydrogenase (fumarate)
MRAASRRALRAAKRGLVAALLGGLMISGAALAPASPALAQDEVGISGLPAGADGAPDGRSRFSFTADPGQQIADQYLVQNTGTLPQTYTVLGTDAFNDEEGKYALQPTGEPPTDIGAWVGFENGESRIQFELQPGEARLLPFTVTVPENATPGDHAGGIAASVVSPSGQVQIDRRVGTRLYVRVSGDIRVGLSVSALSGEYSGDWWNPFSGTVKMSYTVRNTGNIALASNVEIGLNTWFGIPLDNRAGDSIPELLPGGTRNYTSEAHGVAAWGYLNPWVTLSPFVEGNDPSKRLVTEPTTRDAVVIAMPWLLLLVLVLAALFLVIRRRRRKSNEKKAAEWVAYTEAETRRRIAEERDAAAEETRG